MHRIGRTGRVGRSGRAITFVEPRQRRELEAIEKHANTKIAPWAEGAHVGPTPVAEPRPPAPQAARRRRRPTAGYRKLIASGGRAEGLAEADLIAAIAATGLDGEAIRNVRLLERFALSRCRPASPERVAAGRDGGPTVALGQNWNEGI